MNKKWYIVNVEAAIYHQDKWLLIRRSVKEEHAPGVITLVGGKVEEQVNVNASDVLEKTLKREVLEEVGIEVDGLQYLESKTFLATNNEPVVDIVFICKYRAGEPYVVDDTEVAEVFWKKPLEIIANKEIPDFVKDTIEKAELIRIEREKNEKKLAIKKITDIIENPGMDFKKYRIKSIKK